VRKSRKRREVDALTWKTYSVKVPAATLGSCPPGRMLRPVASGTDHNMRYRIVRLTLEALVLLLAFITVALFFWLRLP
jgi:hypothetical protein